ncbi:MAG: hypothetical protein JO146_01555, partial [Candidatus Eremiobacteraeota bacterium]|nr:hypothetical protein [Candidatus Eremiobacteraeota bacterium]
MKPLGLKACALFACCVAITGCSQGTGLSPKQYVPSANIADDRIQKPSSYQVLYSFKDLPDGHRPSAGLVNMNGTLFGTTSDGGANRYYGTVFSITTAGAEKVLYSFNRTDGDGPVASLIDVDGTLYGTALRGGVDSRSSGTVFSITTGGIGNVLHSFNAKGDGQYPHAGLV